jgi:hypothetical protein
VVVVISILVRNRVQPVLAKRKEVA